MNNAIILGRMTNDPEVRYTNNEKCVVQFTLAVDRPYTNQEGKKEADFIPCVMWGKAAEVIGNTVRKGQRILVSGRIQVRNYEGKDGAKRYITEIVVNNFEYIERKDHAETASTPKQAGFSEMGSNIPYDEEIPF